MSSEVLIALFGGTGFATIVGIIVQVWRERRGDVQKDMAGDLTLGELFRDAARKEVIAVQKDMESMHLQFDKVRALADEQNQQIRDLRAAYETCETKCKLLLMRWPAHESLPPEWPS
jgi:hypothetical protein